jgi:hypothetical protein
MRGLADRRHVRGEDDTAPPREPTATAAWPVLRAALATVVAIVVISLAIWGPGPWAEYLDVLRAGTGADLVSRLNIGPASQLALLTGDDSVAARLAPAVTAAALGLTAVAAWVLRPVTLSLAVAAAASLIVTPITWFHYPVALLPFAAAAWLQARDSADAARTAGLLVAALVVAGLSISEPVAVWLAVALVIVACRPPAQAARA